MDLLDSNPGLTRRQWLGGAAALGAASALPALPAWAQAPEAWPNVSRLIASYVDARKVANMVATLGFGQAEPTVIAAGVDSFTGPRTSDARQHLPHLFDDQADHRHGGDDADRRGQARARPAARTRSCPSSARCRCRRSTTARSPPTISSRRCGPITIRQLLTHTAGLGYGIVQSGPIAEAFRERGVVPGLVTRLQALPIFRGTPVHGLDAVRRPARRVAAGLPAGHASGATRWRST